jgi:hypothetical protein
MQLHLQWEREASTPYLVKIEMLLIERGLLE